MKFPRARAQRSAWDLTALLNAAAGQHDRAERHLWLARLLEWLRHAPASGDAGTGPTHPAVLRLRHLLNVLDKNPEHGAQVRGLMHAFWRDIRSVGLFSDFGFSPRMGVASEFMERLRLRLLPSTPDTRELAELFALLFMPGDEEWLARIDDDTLARLSQPGWRGPDEAAAQADAAAVERWRSEMMDAVTYLVSAVRAAGFSAPLRKRMSAEALANEPFRQLAGATELLREAVLLGGGSALASPALRQASSLLRVLLDQCRHAVDTIADHLDEYGISVNIVYEVDQLRARIARIEQLLDCVLSPTPGHEMQRLAVSLVSTLEQRRGLRTLLAQHYAQLARKVAERSAETGEHYIAHNRAEYRDMLRRAAGGGAVLAGTTLLKFGVLALGLGAFWGGFWAGMNYAASFVIIMLLHWTVATKQPAMTAPAMAQRLGQLVAPKAADHGVRSHEGERGEATHRFLERDESVEAFIDDVVHLVRSQAAGIFGNLALCAPLVLAAQLAGWALLGEPLVGKAEAEHVLHSLTLLGPTAIYAAFTGVLLFASSLIAGWVENWFVFHRLESAIAWNPRIVTALGAARARRWSAWWRRNISGVAANVSLGMMLGLVPVVLAFLGLPLDVRHVTLSTGQVAAAAGALGFEVLHHAPFWWCVAGIAVTGVLNIGVSFWCAFNVAARARGVRAVDRKRLGAALSRRLRGSLPSFLWPTAKE